MVFPFLFDKLTTELRSYPGKSPETTTTSYFLSFFVKFYWVSNKNYLTLIPWFFIASYF